MDVSPINMKKIYQNIIEQFIYLVKEGKLKVGDKLPPERTLAEMFNVSRASVREAFSAMEIIGFIEVRKGEGSYVANLNISSFINTISPLFINNENMETDLLEFRKLIEIEAVKLAADKSAAVNLADGNLMNSRFDDEKLSNEQTLNQQTLAAKPACMDFTEIEECIELMSKAIENDDMAAGQEADIMFHRCIFNMADNIILKKAAECTACLLESSVKFNRSKILRNQENTKVLYDQHIEIYEAIKKGDTAAASERMKKHIDQVKEQAG